LEGISRADNGISVFALVRELNEGTWVIYQYYLEVLYFY